jgi:serine/threonine-protein kinase
MGVVWAARDTELQRRVALKMIRPEIGADPVARERLIAEARAMARLTHPNVLAVYDVGDLDGELFIATELVEGETLATWQRGRHASEVAGAYAQAARGLHAAHCADLIHRDVKPSNLLMGRDGRVRVADFGLALAGESVGASFASGSDERLTHDGAIVGTPAYLAPEQRAAGTANARTDQFSLCVALAEALTGDRPKAGISRAELIDGGAAAELAAILARGLSVDPAQRYSSMDHLADALAAAATGRRDRSRLRPWHAAAMSALLVGGLVWTAMPSRSSRPAPAELPGARSADGESSIDRADRLLRARDGSGCLRALEHTQVAGDPRLAERVETLRWRCEMASGVCDQGIARARRAGATAVLIEHEAAAFCPVDQGELAARVRRLSTQVLTFAQYRNTGCDAYADAALGLARTPDLGAVAGARDVVQASLAHLVSCHARKRHCDQARQLIDRAGDAGVIVDEAALEGCR